jgi:hypothetical protein
MERLYTKLLARDSEKIVVDDDPQHIKFATMEALRLDIDSFLQDYGLPTDLVVAHRDPWRYFQAHLSSVLADQPLIKPCEGIVSCTFLPAAEGCVIMEITYIDKNGDTQVERLKGSY